jgi:hypothetical protein
MSNLNPKQFNYDEAPSHLSAKDIVKHYDLGDFNEEPEHYGESEHEFLQRRYQSKTGQKLSKSIAEKGYSSKKPLEIYDNRMVNDGHHRLAVMYFEHPNTPIPLRHTDE